VGSADCLLCPQGRYADTLGSSACTACPSGRFGNTTSLSDPLCSGACEAGYTCPQASTSQREIRCNGRAVFCPPQSNVSIPVSTGFHSIGCLEGDGSACTGEAICDEGTYCAGGVQTPCAPGTYAETKGLAACAPCASGKYQNSTGQTSCLPCPARSGQPLAGRSSCDPCPPKYYSPPSLGQCQACVAPLVVSSDGLNCTGFFCELGHHWDYDSATCVPCGIGTYSDVAGATLTCARAPANTYVPVTGSTTPLECSGVDGIECVDGQAYNRVNYWAYTVDARTGQVDAMLCLPKHCVSGFREGKSCATNRNQDSSNVLCGQCLEGYSEWSGDCVDCRDGDSRGGFIVLLLIVTFAAVVIVHVLAQARKTAIVSGKDGFAFLIATILCITNQIAY